MAGQDYLAKIKLSLEGQEQVISGLKNTQQEAQKLASTKITTAFDKEGIAAGATVVQTFKDAGKEATNAKAKVSELGLAFRRAFIVAPVWMVARQILQEMISFVTEGVQHYIDTEKAVLNVRSALLAMGQAGTGTIADLTERFHALSVETGNAESKIMNTYASVNRILGNTEKSFMATNAAVKLGEATGTDAAKIAETLAYLYKLQGDTIKGASTDTQKFAELQVMLYAAQAKVPGGIEKLNSELMAGIPIMKEANLSIEDFIKLNIAMNQAGITTSQTLKTGLMKVLTNLPQITQQLNIAPNTQPLEVFMTALERMSNLYKQGNLSAFGNAIKDIFGGIRGGQIAVLASDIETLRKSMSEPFVTPQATYEYNTQLKEVSASSNHQIEIFQNLKKQAGDAFITGILGGKDFAEAMKNLNTTMDSSATILHGIGVGLRQFGGYLKELTPGLNFIFAAEERYKKLNNEIARTSDLMKRIDLGMRGQLTLQDTTALIGEISQANILNKTRYIKQLQEQANAIAKNASAEQSASKQQADSDILTKKQVAEIDKLKKSFTKERQKDIKQENEALISFVGTVAKLQGLDQSQVIRQQMAYRNLLQGENYLVKLQEDRLRLAEALTLEAEKQEQKSAHLVDLYKIARRYGMQTAQEVSQFMGGGREFRQLTPDAQRALRRFQPGMYEEGKAGEFFTQPGRGGFQFPEQVQEERRARRARQILNQVTVEPIDMTLNVNIDSEQIIAKMKEAINYELDRKASELQQKIDNIATNSTELY